MTSRTACRRNQTHVGRKLYLADVARIVHGRIPGPRTNPSVVGTCSIDNYLHHRVTFIKGPKFVDRLTGVQNVIALIPENLAYLAEDYPQHTFVVVEDVTKAMIDLQDYYYGPNPAEADAQPLAVDWNGPDILAHNIRVGEHLHIASAVKISADLILGNGISIGENTLIEPGVVIYPGSTIGRNSILHSGCCIGTDGFKFYQDYKERAVYKMVHAGHVTIGNRVEIGCNSTICRGTFENNPTVIGDDVKIGNQVDIAHNVKIGARTIIAPQSCICGSSVIGDDVWIGVGVTVSDHLKVGDRAKLLLNAVVAHDVENEEIVSGFYAMEHRQWKRAHKALCDLGAGEANG